jgi:hypothetical protein
MKVRIMAAAEDGNDASAQYRLWNPALVLQAQGFDVEISTQLEGVGWRDVVTDEGMDARVASFPKVADVLVVQRPVMRNMADAVELAAKHTCVIVDLDDDFSCIPANNQAHRILHPNNSPLRNWAHLDRAVRAAHYVTVSTPALAARYGKGRPHSVLPNFVPRSYLDIPRPVRPDKHRAVVGWSGSLGTHPDDLEAAGGGVGAAVNATRTTFRVVGPQDERDEVGRRLGLNFRPVASGWVPLDQYPKEMARFDVGIVPLADHKFNAAKSWLKGMELASLGIAPVMSPSPSNQALHRLGIGALARRPRDWDAKLRALILASYVEEGLRAREIVAAKLTIEDNAHRWAAAWGEAFARAIPRRVA